MADAGSRSKAAAVGGAFRRVGASWRALEGEQRTAAGAALALFVTMFLPWYSRTAVGVVKGKPLKVDDSLTAFQEFSFVEAAVLLVAVGVLWMLFARGEGKAFHLPFGDGNVIFAAGIWVCLLVFYRQFDKPSPAPVEGLATTVGVTWGIFVTFLTGLFLAVSGQRLRGAHLAEPALPGDVASTDAPLPAGRRGGPSKASERAAARAARRAGSPDDEHDDDGPTRVTRVDPEAAGDDARPRPRGQSAPTVVDRRGPSVDETLVTHVPEYPPRPPKRSEDAAPPGEDPPADPDGQLRLGD